MLHLFNKVFLKPDINFFKSKDSIIISPKISQHLHHFEDDFLKKVNEIDFGTVHFYGTSFQELLDKNFNGNEQLFFDFLLNFDPNTRLTVYCDKNTFEYIMIRVLKTILPNANLSTLYTIYKLSLLRYKHIWGHPYVPFIRLNEAEAAEFKEFGSNIKTIEQANVDWISIMPIETTTNLPAIASLEYQLATYMVSPLWEHKPILEEKMDSIIKKTLVRVYIDQKQAMLKHLYQLPGFDIMSSSLEDFVTVNPDYQMLLDDNFLPDQYKTVFDTYYPETLRLFIEQMISRRYDYVDASNMFEFNPTILDPRQHVLDQVILLERNSEALQVMGTWDYQTTLNTYVLKHILTLYRHNDLESLQKFSLIGV